MRKLLLLSASIAVGACTAEPAANEAAEDATVQTTGKQETAVGDVPADVIAAARQRVPDMKIGAAEAETREGRRYFDIGGTLADGSEIELDIMEEGGRWRVVETQRDIAFAAAPGPVREAARAQDAAFAPTRVIESTQEDGLVIYELYGPAGGDPQRSKVEVKWDGREASVLTQEWAH